MSAKILLTGASGFIGRYCLEYLCSQGQTVYCLSRERREDNNTEDPSGKGIRWIQCDILDERQQAQVFDALSPDYLIHCAWYVEHQKFWSSPLNIDYLFATLSLWKNFIRHKGKKAVFLGSCAEMTESVHTLESASIYGKAKLLTAQMIALIHECEMKSSCFIWGKIFGVYGPGENQSRIVPYLLSSFMEGKAPIIQRPNLTYDFIYVKNLAKQIVEVLWSDVEGYIDFGQNMVFAIKTLSETIHKCFFSSNQKPECIAENEETQRFIPDLSWITSKPDFISFEDSIKEYISYLKKEMVGKAHGTVL